MGWCTGSIGQCVAGSSPACPTNAKAMCGAWLGAYALPGRLDPANPYFYNSSDRHPGKTGPRRAESRYQPQGRTMRFARRVRCCRCKNQRGWAREFLTVFDWKKRDALQGYNATARRSASRHHASVGQRQTSSFPSWVRGFDSRRWLQTGLVTLSSISSHNSLHGGGGMETIV